MSRRASPSFAGHRDLPLPADVQQLVAASRATLEAFALDLEAGRLPRLQYASLHLLEQALLAFPSPAHLTPAPGQRPPGGLALIRPAADLAQDSGRGAP